MKISFSTVVASFVLLTAFAAVAPTQARAADTSKNQAKALNHERDDDLRQAVISANFGAVQKALSHGADPNTKSNDAEAVPLLAYIIMAPAHNEAEEGAKFKIMHAFVEAGADLEATDIYGNTALWDAAANRNMSALHYLLTSGANLEHGNDNGTTPLMAAATFAHEDSVRALTDAGAKVNARSKSDVTALIAAANFIPANVDPSSSEGWNKTLRLNIVRWLLSKGADIDARTKDGVDAITIADATGMPDVSALLRNAKANGTSNTNAANTSNIQTSNSTADALKVDENGFTTLMIAISDTPFDVTKAAALVKAGVDVNAVDKKTESTLINACVASSPEAVRFLIKNGAKVNYADNDGATALMYALFSDNSDQALDMVGQLIAAGADVNAKGGDGTTVLDVAHAKGNARVIDALVKAGAK